MGYSYKPWVALKHSASGLGWSRDHLCFGVHQMIVFKKDWLRYKNAIADTNTQNTYFLQHCKLLKDMGIDHWYFPLALLQPELAGLSVYDKNLTKEQKSMMLYEADNNPWFYLRELVIDPKGGIDIDDMRYRAHRGNIAGMWLLLANIDYIWIAPRQTGKSFGADANTNWLEYFCYRDTDLNLVTKDNKTRVSNISRLKLIRDAWPDFMCRNSREDAANQNSTSCIELGNYLYTHVAQSSVKGANNMGRGLTSPYLQIDEAAFITYIQKTLSAASGGTNTAREINRRKNKPYCTVFTTTAGDIEDRDGAFVHQMWLEGAPWIESFFDAPDRDTLTEMIVRNSKSTSPVPFVNITLSHKQLGYTDAWLLDAIFRARGEGSDIDKDYFNRWGSSSDNSVIPREIAKVIKEHEADPINVYVSKDNYMLDWHRTVDPEGNYIWTIDSSSAVGRDDMAFVLLDVSDGGTVAVAAINDTNLMTLNYWILDLLLLIKRSVLVIENEHNAQQIIDFLLLMLPQYGEDPYRRMFSRIVQNSSDHAEAFKEISNGGAQRSKIIADKYKKYIGFKTNGESRAFLYGPVLSNAVREGGALIKDRRLVHQMLSLRKKNNRVDHQSGGHDDLVIAWLMGQWFLSHGMNLSHYGINPRDVLCNRTAIEKEVDPLRLHMQSMQKRHRERLEALEEAREASKDVYQKRRMDSEIRRLKENQEDDVVETGHTIDQLVQYAKDKKDPRITRGAENRPRNNASRLLEAFGG